MGNSLKSENQEAVIDNREFGADLVRIAGMCLLLWLHFFLRNGFYYTPVTDFGSFLAVMFRPIFMVCVPLFAMLTGYLKCGKEWGRSYYKPLLSIIITWIFISGIHLLYKIFIQHVEKSAGDWLVSFFGFQLADYSWYIGMYIGLFLLSPIINLVWNAIKTKKGHIAIVLTFAAVSFLPATINSISTFFELEENLLPAYFTQTYFLGYYVIGCYVKTYRPKLNRIVGIVIILAVSAVLGVLNMISRRVPDEYYSGYNASYSHLAIAVLTGIVFLCLYQINCQRSAIRLVAQWISTVVLEMYLLSYLFDSNIYVLFEGQYTSGDYIWVGFLMTLAVFVLSFIAANIVHWVCKFITNLFTSNK